MIELITYFIIIMSISLVIGCIFIGLFIMYMESQNKIKLYRIDKYMNYYKNAVNNIMETVKYIKNNIENEIKYNDEYQDENINNLMAKCINDEYRHIINNYSYSKTRLSEIENRIEEKLRCLEFDGNKYKIFFNIKDKEYNFNYTIKNI